MRARRVFGAYGMLVCGVLLGACAQDGEGTERRESGPPDAGEEPTCGDERASVATSRVPIVNGQDSWDPEVLQLDERQALAVGALLMRWIDSWYNGCTGTLVAPDRVLTAAHCVTDSLGATRSAASLRFALGEDAARPLATIAVRAVHRHPDYEPGRRTAAHDVAVLDLARPATDLLPGLQPIPYNCEPLDAAGFVGSWLQAVGYGATTRQGDDRNSRRYWTVQELVALGRVDFTVNGDGVSGVCFGDSGGPGLWMVPKLGVRIVGTLSWGGELCAGLDHFMRVDPECDFLDPLMTPCGEVTAAGSCAGTVAVYCEAGTVVRTRCAVGQQRCGDDGTGAQRCIADPCQGETLSGRCAGDDVRWCEEGRVKVRHCADCGQRCGPSTAHDGYYCVSADD